LICIFGDCELDTCLYSVQRGGQTIRLRPKVFRVCLYLLQHRERVVSAKELSAQAWSGQVISPRTLKGVIRGLRQAVGESGRAQGIIQTLYGYGYGFVVAVEERPIKVRERGGRPTSYVPSAEGALALGQPVGGTHSVASGSVWNARSMRQGLESGAVVRPLRTRVRGLARPAKFLEASIPRARAVIVGHR
jgi:DNA-binding winged helix-turn-helix (wHTH) protein